MIADLRNQITQCPTHSKPDWNINLKWSQVKRRQGSLCLHPDLVTLRAGAIISKEAEAFKFWDLALLPGFLIFRHAFFPQERRGEGERTEWHRCLRNSSPRSVKCRIMGIVEETGGLS